MKTSTENLLKELYKAADMGKKATNMVMAKVKDNDLKEQLATRYGYYAQMEERTTKELVEENIIPAEINVMEKAMLWSGVEMGNLKEHSESGLAEMMIDGFEMGIKSLEKSYRENDNADTHVKHMVNEYLTSERQHITELKNFI